MIEFLKKRKDTGNSKGTGNKRNRLGDRQDVIDWEMK